MRRGSKGKKRKVRFLPFFFVVLLTAVSVYVLSAFIRIFMNPKSEGGRFDIRVEVLNGCAVPRLAREVSWELRKLGFDVVRVGDAHQNDFARTVVIERRHEKLSNAKKLARRIRCNNILKDIDSTLYLEATLIVGKDYQKLFPGLNLSTE